MKLFLNIYKLHTIESKRKQIVKNEYEDRNIDNLLKMM